MSVDLLQQIAHYEKLSRQLDPDHAQRSAWGHMGLEHVLTFLQNIKGNKMFWLGPDQAKKVLNYTPPEEGIELEEVLQLIHEELDEKGLKASSGGHMAYIPGGGLFPSGLGDLIAAICNYYSGAFFVAPGAVRIENILIRWVAKMIGYDPKNCQGNLSSGGSYAGLIAMHTARESLDISAKDIPQTVVYFSQQTHHALEKALKVIGMKEAIYRRVPMDEDFRMIPSELERMLLEDHDSGLKPAILIGSMGTTDVGAVDPLSELAEISEKYGLWFHVDAAYGGFFMLLDEFKQKYPGLSRSDSMVIDPHKGLFMPWGTGMVIVREGKKLLNTFASDAAYLQDLIEDDIEYSPSDLSPELTRHFRGLRVWLPLQLFGVNSFKAALKEKLLLTQYAFYRFQQTEGIELPLQPQLTVILFRIKSPHQDDNTFNQKLIKGILEDGRVFISSTRIEGKIYLRLTILHFRTHLEEVKLFFDILEAQRQKLLTGEKVD
ncbi:MAG: aminotransferase class I/II-fold pyridoxal phosphate-dependent enzyme [Bacteroidota bacterium]